MKQNRLTAYRGRGVITYCSACGKMLKPDVILFGEQLPAEVWKEAREMMRRCDLLLVVGSSLTVVPVARLPEIVTGKKLVSSFSIEQKRNLMGNNLSRCGRNSPENNSEGAL